jgi:hypothetical protein
MQRPPSLPADDLADRGRPTPGEPEGVPPAAGYAAEAPTPDPEVEREAFARRHVMSEALIALLARLAG